MAITEAELRVSPTLLTTAMAAELAISLVIRNSLHVLSERKILSRGVRDQINTAVHDLQKLLESGTDDEQQSRVGSGLLVRARDTVDLADKFLLKASRHLKPHKGRLAKIRALVHFMSLWIRVRATNRMAEDFITRVKGLSTHLSQMQDLPGNDLRNLDENASSRNAHQGKVRWNGKVESDVVGRERETEELLAQLIVKDGDEERSRLRVISVVGEEAIGKTALVRSVYNSLKIDHRFHCRVWVCVSKELSLKDLLVKILKQTPQKELKDLEHIKEETLKERLHSSLMELRYLIVFDNLRELKLMDELMYLLTDSRKGSRVIVTTRDDRIPSLIDPWASPLVLEKLDPDQSGECLLGFCGSFAEDLGLKERILSKCSGFPPSILLLGGLAAASKGSSAVIGGQLADNPSLRDVASFSYHKLPSLLKPCLLYLCLFPKDSEISTRRLFRLWLAEGLVQELGFTAAECFEELIGRNLVQVVRRRKITGEPKSCRVPSFLHDFLCEMATRFRLLQIQSDTKGTYHGEESKVVNGCSWIVKYQENNYHQESQKSAEMEDHQHGSIQLQNLRSYVSFKMQKHGTRSREVEELLRPLISKGDSGLLRVLNLEGVYKPLLPDGLGDVLLNLTYLGLRWTALDSIPESVRNMSRLETLDLKHTNVRNLPSSIWKMKYLQHLYMSEVCFDKSTNLCKPSAKYPSNLETLWGLYIGVAESPMLGVLRNLTKLKKLGLTCDFPVTEEATKSISNLKELQSLNLRSRDLFGQPSELKLSDMRGLDSLSDLYLLGSLPAGDNLTLLPQNLQILTLSMSRLDDHSIEVLGRFESLEILNLFAGSYTGPTLECGVDSFPRLRVLKLWKLEGVEEAYVPKTAFCRLEELEIKNCGDLTYFDSLDHIESLKQISLIKVKEELATNIKRGLARNLLINGEQVVTPSSSSSSRQVFIKEKQLVPSSPSSA